MTKQLELIPAAEKARRDTAIEEVLREAGDWMTASALVQTFGVRGMFNSLDSAKREVRAWASESPRVISGQNGYKHIANATEDEVKAFMSFMYSQANSMMKRAYAVNAEYLRTVG